MKRVLLASLDWGLGHATRCIPIIQELLKRSCEVYLAGSGDSLTLLQIEFPALKTFSIAAYQPVYPVAGSSMAWKMISQIPHFLRVINKEHDEVERIIREQKIDLIISDNRYGCWSAKVPCVFITHQSNILMPKRFGWIAPFVRQLNERMIKRFSFCWIPDYPGDDSLAGDLISFGGMDPSIQVRHIGWLSRFSTPQAAEKKIDLLCVFSGPEPQRSILEEIVMRQVKRLASIKVLIVRGLPGSLSFPSDAGVEVVNFLSSKDLQNAINSSSIVLARSGFSTVMDLAKLGGKAIFVPTPGQTEQEYLAKRLFEKNIAYFMNQERIDIVFALKESMRFTGFPRTSSGSALLKEAIDEIITFTNTTEQQ